MSTEQEETLRRYNRIAPFFDVMEGMIEGLFFSRLRKQIWHQVEGEHVLEVGVGTGKNFPYYPAEKQMTAIDFSPVMLRQAKNKLQRRPVNVALDQMDVEQLFFADNSFDTVIGTFLFCSVPRPKRGLQELYRVCKPGGQVLLLEHVLSSNAALAATMNFLNPVVKRMMGANINRETVKNVKSCAFDKVRVDPVSGHVVKLIKAIK